MKNSFELIGRISSVNKNENYVNFSVAVDESYKAKDAEEWTEKTDFHNCVAFDRTMNSFDSYVQKGDLVKVVGKITWKEKEIEGKKYNLASLVAKNFLRLSRPNSDKKED